jgi:hypothetical protein
LILILTPMLIKHVFENQQNLQVICPTHLF